MDKNVITNMVMSIISKYKYCCFKRKIPYLQTALGNDTPFIVIKHCGTRTYGRNMVATVRDAESVTCKIGTLARQVTSTAARLLAEYGVTPNQANVFYALSQGETSPSAIARSMGMDASNLSRVIGGMEKDEYLVRTIDPEHRTRIEVRLTEKGVRKAEEIDPHAGQIYQQIARVLSEAELESFVAMMDRISDALDEVSPTQ